ncbi:MAG: hypothetical protein M1821_008973 [Bathelium mastoideum]|nr:MAG: hypothetical protein M1821_008973 [Bathelium mastoideum]
MAATKLIVVVGATGNQGSSVAKTFLGLADRWRVRCLTRNPSSAAAEGLAAKGAETVQGDLQDPSSLTKAFDGAAAIFLNTDFWGTYRPAKAALEAENQSVAPASKKAYDYETTCGKNAVDVAARVPSLERFIYTALHAIKKTSGGKYTHSLHSEAKAWIVEYIEEVKPELAVKTSFVYPGAYNTNAMFTPRLDPGSGKYVFALPVRNDLPIPVLDPRESLGLFVQELIENETAGKKLLAYDSEILAGDIPTEWSKASGKEATFVPITVQVMHEKFGMPWELLDTPQFLNDYGYRGGIDGLIEPSQLKNVPQTKSFETWLRERDCLEVLAA